MKSIAANRYVNLIRSSGENESNNKFRISYNGLRRENQLKPHKSFRNWSQFFKIPSFCFIDIAIFSLYLILAIYHEKTLVSQAVNTAKAMDSFFMNELNDITNDVQKSTKYFSKNENRKNIKNQNQGLSKSLNILSPTTGIPYGNGQIYLIDDFLILLDVLSQKLFDFPTHFPMKYPVHSPTFVHLNILLENNTFIQFNMTNDQNDLKQTNLKKISTDNSQKFEEKSFFANTAKIRRSKKKANSKTILDATQPKSSTNSQPSKFVVPYLSTFTSVTLKASYYIQIHNKAGDIRVNLGITSTFVKDPRTGTLIFDVTHSRITENESLQKISMFLYSFTYSIPIFILILNIVSIWTQISSIHNLYLYSKSKNLAVGLDSRDIFNQHFSKWTIFSIITHFISVIAMLLYMNIGQDISQTLPPINVITSVATCMQCLLLIRYLNLKESTFLIIKVLYKSLMILMEFLLGCLPFFAAFWVFGICFYGHLSFMFASPLQCASYLFCVMHGDSILDFFDNTIVQNDYSVYLGFVYCLAWICFALLLMFNVTISIVQDVLREESAKMQQKDDIQVHPHKTPLNMDLLTNGLFHSL